MLKRSIVTALLVVFFSQAQGSAGAQETFLPEIERTADWIVNMAPAARSDYLKSASPELSTIVNVDLNFHFSQINKPSKFTHSQRYKRLVFAGERPLGLRLYSVPEIEHGDIGAIVIEPYEPSDINNHAIANAVIRTFLDLSLKKCSVAAVLAPPGLYKDLSQELTRQNFQPFYPDPNKRIPPLLTLRSYSGDVGQSFFYAKGTNL